MYEEYYDIKTKPFQLTPDPKFFFASSKHKQALAYLQYGLEQGEGFIVITGPVGTGKTTLALSLLQQIKNSNIKAIQIVTCRLSPEDLLAVIVKEFGLTPSSNNKSELLKSIERHLIYLAEQGKRALLLVDEAQNLPTDTVEELRMLSNFQKNGKPLLQSFLLGQEELRTIIQSPEMEQFRQRIIASCHLQPLSTDEVSKYINHRLNLAEIKNPNLFSEDCFTIIQQKTLGVPRKINLLMDRTLLYGFLNNVKFFEVNDVLAVIDEMADELSASIHTSHSMEAAAVTRGLINTQENQQNVNYDNENIMQLLTKMDDFLQENIEKKIKMNRYLDKLIKQKNLIVAKPNGRDENTETRN
ncbi:XrtA-associated ATPase [Thalassotalea fonticola]|uniref:XrtA-associated ATPase n=1 Tax=Thalassotalea fonticola TaxID=3065649 RepID=A0ABZ0GLD2_9GAMM|nr:XrtA-associated ATPase [Colwelliaceae bacterium S1-1]